MLLFVCSNAPVLGKGLILRESAIIGRMEVSMELLLERAQKSGDVLVAVRFDKSQRNFSVEELKWWPRLEELDMLVDARRMIMEAQGKEAGVGKKVREWKPDDIPF